jgi:hypothetical protein
MNVEKNNQNKQNEIAKTWLSGSRSVTLILNRAIAEEYDLIDPQYVILERQKNGILIRRIRE